MSLNILLICSVSTCVTWQIKQTNWNIISRRQKPWRRNIDQCSFNPAAAESRWRLLKRKLHLKLVLWFESRDLRLWAAGLLMTERTAVLLFNPSSHFSLLSSISVCFLSPLFAYFHCTLNSVICRQRGQELTAINVIFRGHFYLKHLIKTAGGGLFLVLTGADQCVMHSLAHTLVL